MDYHRILRFKTWLLGSLCLLLFLILACGTAEESPAVEPATSETASQSVSEVAGISAEKAPAPVAQREPAAAPGAPSSGTDTMAKAEPAPTAVPAAAPAEPKVAARSVTRLQYAIGAVANESNRPWAGGRQAYVLFDPILEQAIGINATSSAYVPELATKWEANDDLTEWTFHIREGVQFHNGWGELTAKDFRHTAEILTREDSRQGTGRYFTGRRDKVGPDQYFKEIDDYTFTIVCHEDGAPTTTFDFEFVMSNASSEMGPWSVDFWESVGGDGKIYGCGADDAACQANLEAREKNLDEYGMQGSASYQFLELVPAEAFIVEKTPGRHWSQDADDVPAEDPDFQEVRIHWVIEDASRYAALRAGEAHMADLPLDLQKDGAAHGLSLIRSQFTANNFFVFFGGMYLSSDTRDVEAFDNTVPWANKEHGIKVREAMNKAINREELLEQLYKGIGEPMYVGYYHPSHYGWDDTWPERYESKYKYDPDRAMELLAEAGYGPDNPVKVTAQSYVSPGESELPQAMEAIANYWQQVGIEVDIEDLDGATVRDRYRGRKMQHRVWPNIIIYFPLEYGVTGLLSSSVGVSNHYQDDWTNEKAVLWRTITDFDERDKIAREFGNYAFENYVNMPLFWFPHTVAVDPSVVSDWVYPGSTVPRGGHLHSVKAAAK